MMMLELPKKIRGSQTCQIIASLHHKSEVVLRTGSTNGDENSPLFSIVVAVCNGKMHMVNNPSRKPFANFGFDGDMELLAIPIN